MDKYQCDMCGKSFSQAWNVLRHKSSCKKEKKHVDLNCGLCNAKFSRKDNLKRHEEIKHGGRTEGKELAYACGMCALTFGCRDELKNHRLSHLKESGEPGGFFLLDSAHKRVAQIFRNFLPSDKIALDQALNYVNSEVLNLVKKLLLEHPVIKIGLVLNVEFVKIEENVTISETIVCPFRSKQQKCTKFEMFSFNVLEALTEIESNINEFLSRGSGWSINDIIFCDVEVVHCKTLAGSCGLHSATHTGVRGGGISMKSTGLMSEQECLSTANNECFYLAVARHFVGKEGEKCEDKLQSFINERIKKNVPTPVKLEDICNFEDEHPELDLSINVVYRDEDDFVYPVRVGKNIHAQNTIVLLLAFTTSSGNKMHYAYIPNPEAFLAPRRSDKGGSHKDKAKLCFNCFNWIYREYTYEEHVLWCHSKTGQRVIMPQEEEKMKFESEHKEREVAYTIFFDFETLQCNPEKGSCSCTNEMREEKKRLDAMSEKELEDESILRSLESNFSDHRPQPFCKHKSMVLTEQKPFAVAFVMVDRTGKVVEDGHFIGEDCASQFLEELFRIEKKYEEVLEKGVPMIITEEVKYARENEEFCHICGSQLDGDRVADHDHLTGEFIGMAHNICNLQRSEPQIITVFAHNFSGYDSHILIKELGKVIVITSCTYLF